MYKSLSNEAKYVALIYTIEYLRMLPDPVDASGEDPCESLDQVTCPGVAGPREADQGNELGAGAVGEEPGVEPGAAGVARPLGPELAAPVQAQAEHGTVATGAAGSQAHVETRNIFCCLLYTSPSPRD